jgi:hypothetical protein
MGKPENTPLFEKYLHAVWDSVFGAREVAGSSPAGGSRKFQKPRIEERHKTLAATKPWEALGMSRRTWYRRQKERR